MSAKFTNDVPSPHSAAWLLLFFAWLIAMVSTLGALFFSEVMAIAPCTLCWYQRIFMFPLALILPLALFPLDVKVVRYTLPLVLVGLLFALFHWLLQLGIIPPTLSPCSQGVPCTADTWAWFGFLTIPLMSLLAFASLVILLIAAQIQGKK